MQFPPTEETIQKLLFTKYRDWKYEEEWRGWFRLETRDPITGLCFCSLDDKIQLREVIAGPLCDTPKAKIRAALGADLRSVLAVKARLAFATFQVVTNKRGFAHS